MHGNNGSSIVTENPTNSFSPGGMAGSEQFDLRVTLKSESERDFNERIIVFLYSQF